MNVVGTAGCEEVARVYIADLDGRMIEFVESVQPPVPISEKWVLMVSTLFGCPVGCPICDAGGAYSGKLDADQIFYQIDHMISQRFPDRSIPVAKFKIQFARMGEPAYNDAVLEVLSEFPNRYDAPGFMPSISTIAPAGREEWFDRLRSIKDRHYGNGRFQLQFSIHTTDGPLRDRLIPTEKWGLARIGAYGAGFRNDGDRKVTLNFALERSSPVDPRTMLENFHPDHFLIKVTPLNPTYSAVSNSMDSYISNDRIEGYEIVESLRDAGYEVIVSIGDAEESLIGSNCGQYVLSHMKALSSIHGAYEYDVTSI